MNTYDLFLSYRRNQALTVAPWIEALRAAGLSVWQDTRDLDLLTDFSAEIADALSASKALLVWYSADYAESIPCQWELTAAFIAAQRAGQPLRRIFVVNPETDASHIVLPAELAGSNFIESAKTSKDAFVKAIDQRARAIDTPFGAVRPATPPRWLPHKPAAAPYFLGRHRDLWRLQSKLLIGSDVSITAAAPSLRVCIRGLGGMGKTLLAQQYALQFGWAWPGGVYWFNGYGGNTGSNEGYDLRSVLETQLYNLAKTLDINVDNLDLPAVQGRLRRELERSGEAYLWIIDDVPPGVPVDTLGAWSAPTARGKTLVTTRSRQYSRTDAELELRGLDPEPAMALLASRRAPQGAEESATAARIVELLGGHAQALEVASAAVHGSFDPQPYACLLAALDDIADDALEAGPGDLDQLPTGHDRSVARTLLGSIKLLEQPAREVLFLSALLSAAPIPVDLLTTVLLSPTCTQKHAEQAVKSLETHALASFDRTTRAVSVHPIVIYVVRRWRDAQAAIAAMRQKAVRAVTAALAPVDDIRAHGDLEFQILHGHALVKAGNTTADAGLLLNLAAGDYARGAYVAARESQLKALEICRRDLREEDPRTLATMSNLAGTLRAQGDLAGARALEEQALVVSRRVLGDEHPNTLALIGNLACTLRAQGDLVATRMLQEQALTVLHRVLGDEHPHTLTSMNNLGGTLRAQGDLAGARALHEQELAICRRVLGDEHPDTLTSMNNLAATLRAQGDLAGARALHEQELAICRRVLGDEHPDTLISMNNLAATLSTQGDLAGALTLQKVVLAVRRRVFGEHPQTSISAWNLFNLLRAMNEAESARKVYAENLAWLVAANPDSLGADQRRIQNQLLPLLRKAQPPVAPTSQTCPP